MPKYLSCVCVCVCVCVSHFLHVRLFVSPWSVACQTPLSMEFCRQAPWSGLPFPFPGDLLDPGIESGSSAMQAESLPSKPPGMLPIIFMLQVIEAKGYPVGSIKARIC